MELKNQYEVAGPAETLWDVLNDVERIAPFVPGFDLKEVEGDTYRGTIKVKVGAITVSYNAEIEVVERDADARRVVMEVSGRERRGPGSVNATVSSTLEPDGARTRIALTTDVQVTGKVAQFGGGVLADVSDALVGQFVRALEGHLQAGDAEHAGSAPGGVDGGGPEREPAPSRASAAAKPPASDVLDNGAVAAPAMLKRMAAGSAAIAWPLAALLAYLLGRAHGERSRR
jgi:carbon monoxide dehydrogenase subunit G